MGHIPASVNTELLNFIANSTRLPVIVTRITGEIMWVNQGTTAWFGYTQQELVGTYIYAWQAQEQSALKQVLSGKTNIEQAFVFVDKQAQEHQVKFEVSPQQEQVVFFGHEVNKPLAVTHNSLRYHRQLEALINNYPGGAITIVDKNLCLIYPQGQTYQQNTLGTQLFKGKHLKDFAPEMVYQALLDKMHLLESKQSFSHKVKIKGFTFTNVYQPVFDENGQLDSIIIITNNVTRLHHYQQQVTEHQGKYQALFELASDAIMLINPVSREIIDANQATVQLLGHSKKELQKLNRNDIIAAEVRDETLQNWTKQLAEKEEARLDTVWVNKEGKTILVEVLGKIIHLPGEEVLMLIGRDRTEYIKIQQELQQSHLIYQSLFENALDAILLVNDEGRYVDVNPAACKLLGYSKAELLNLSVWDITPGTNQTEGKKIWQTFINQAYLTGEYEVICKDGTRRITEFHAVPNIQAGLHLSNLQDITGRKAMEKALADTTRDLKEAVQAGNVGLWYWDLHTNTVEYSPEWKKQLGYAEEDVFNTFEDFTSRVHPDDQPLLNAKIAEVMAGEVQKIEWSFRLRRKDDFYCWVSLQGAAFTNAAGNLVRIKGTQLDITESKQMLQDLKESENRLELALSSAGLGTWDWNLQTGEIIFNERWAKILGYTPEEIAPNISTWEKIRVHPEDMPRVEQALSDHLEGKTTIYREEQRLMTKSGKWVLDTGKVFVRAKHGAPLRAVGTCLDIDERKRNEEELKSLNHKFQLAYEAASIGVWEHNYKTEQSIWDDKMYEIFGVSRQTFKTEKQSWIEQLVHPDDRNRLKEEIATFFHLGITIQENEFRVITPGGKTKYLKSSAYIEYDNSGNPLFGTGLSIDLTYIKEAEAKAKQASKAKSEFLANMSHEIRTPLNGVIGFVDLLLETSLNESQKEYLKTVHQSAHTLLDIITDILDFSKIEAGKMEISITQTDLMHLINQVVSVVKYTVYQKKLELLLDLSDDLPQFIYADDVRFKQILTNLMSNAVKFTEAGEVVLKVELLKQLPDNEAIFRFSVKDTGVGIAPEKQSKVLEAFSQEDASTTRKFGGTGLGLTITNKLLKLMESRLKLKSVPGEGSIFYFDVCFKYEPDSQDSKWTDLTTIKKVMVVDDNEKSRQVMRELIHRQGLEVSLAKNGIELLQKLTQGQRYDVILIDYQMPFMDGLQCIKKIREDLRILRAQQEIILLSSVGNSEAIQQQCDEYGVGQSLVKPTHWQQLYSALHKLAHTRRVENYANQKAYKVLIVEDNEINAILTQSILERILPNATIKEALNGAEAVAQYQTEAPDLIFMDIQMPVMNGHEACKEIRRLEQDFSHPTKIIALTANTSAGEKERCLASGMDDYLSKPIAQTMIEDLLIKWLNID
ncbi:PAS domain S-box protein [Microscilla marina]|uniref:Sensory/regulatory protein RpfC n=1 Tax=Microscilla marina ATCC 23134 TaxID=313606 RepID=A1ZRD2_MICM2|nr:PAS domain S-box protein [Microscilla marina]EAY27022.1 PAS [Microscilla marina ATCC 23134]